MPSRTRALYAQLLAFDAAVTEIVKWLAPAQRLAAWERLCQMRDGATGPSWDALDTVCDVLEPNGFELPPQQERSDP